jgi:hypothetical protein
VDRHSVGEAVVIRGLVIPSAWDDKGSVVGVSIATFDENQYFVDGDEILNQLLEQLRQEVSLSGVVKRTGLRTLVTQCRLLNQQDEQA